ncbi:hypothetical protein [Nostoc sp. CENA543]|nr:hypothetical protein [Nostoc sp. CENA543]
MPRLQELVTDTQQNQNWVKLPMPKRGHLPYRKVGELKKIEM